MLLICLILWPGIDPPPLATPSLRTCTWLSTDGGVNWKDVAEGSYIYEYADWGRGFRDLWFEMVKT